MPTKTTGAEFKRFYADTTFWPDRAWHEEVVFLVDGEQTSDGFDMSTVGDATKVSIDGGIVFGLSQEGAEPSVETHFKRWRKLQSVKTLLIEVDESKLEAILDAIKAAGGKVIR